MKKRSPAGSAADMDTIARELAALRAELDQRRRRDEERERFDAISNALVGELDPAEVLNRAERWATAALGRPCRIVGEPIEAALALGSGEPVAWLAIDAPSLGPEDDAAAQVAAGRIGRALDAAHRVATQARAMHALERSLLPDALLPVPGLQLAKRHVPARGSHDVSGDFYDAVRTGDTVTLIVGDVQGKGIDAATLTSLARHTLRAGALAGQRPAELLAHLNTALLYGQQEQLAAGDDLMLRFVTAAVARLEPADDGTPGFVLTVSRAGQPPPIVVRGDGRYEPIEPSGVLLGVAEHPEFEQIETPFAVGDTLVLYTDGVVDQRGGDGSAMSEQHLGMLVRNRRGVIDAEAIAQLIEDTVHLVTPEEIRDDVAILVACATTRLARRAGVSTRSRRRSSAMSPPAARDGPASHTRCKAPLSNVSNTTGWMYDARTTAGVLRNSWATVSNTTLSARCRCRVVRGRGNAANAAAANKVAPQVRNVFAVTSSSV